MFYSNIFICVMNVKSHWWKVILDFIPSLFAVSHNYRSKLIIFPCWINHRHSNKRSWNEINYYKDHNPASLNWKKQYPVVAYRSFCLKDYECLLLKSFCSLQKIQRIDFNGKQLHLIIKESHKANHSSTSWNSKIVHLRILVTRQCVYVTEANLK